LSIKDKPVIPKWMNVVNANAYIGANEISEIFHIAAGDVTHNIRRGHIPKPDRRHKKLGRGLPKNQWKMSTVLEFINTPK